MFWMTRRDRIVAGLFTWAVVAVTPSARGDVDVTSI
jgi:hypothetical protein